MSTRILLMLVVLLLPMRSLGDVVCDGVDDDLTTALAASNFLSVSTGTMAVWYKPTGTVSGVGPACYDGEFLMGAADVDGVNISLSRNATFGAGLDRLCAYNYDGSTEVAIPAPYTNTAWTHLAWVHTGGTLFFYKDGALVSSSAANNTDALLTPMRLCKGPGWAPIGEGVFTNAQTFATALSASEIAVIAGSRLHRVAPSAPSATWDFARCSDGASCTVAFDDRSGNNRPITPSGTTGAAATWVSYPWGVE